MSYKMLTAGHTSKPLLTYITSLPSALETQSAYKNICPYVTEIDPDKEARNLCGNSLA